MRLQTLFIGTDILDLLRRRQKALQEEIEHYAADDLIRTSESDLAEWFVSKYRIEVPKLGDPEIIDSGDARIDGGHERGRYFRDANDTTIRGTYVVFAVPFEGDDEMFTVRPPTFPLAAPKGVVKDGRLLIRIDRTDHNNELMKSDFDGWHRTIQDFLTQLRIPANEFESQLRKEMPEKLRFRKEKILKDREMVASLGYPIVRRGDAPATYKLPMKRKTIKITKPIPSAGSFEVEPELGMEVYEEILGILSSMVSVMEKSPRAFRTLEEEDLRWHFIVQLNGQYEGQASGETFNFEGKTDIIIKAGDKNVFIAECKIWDGPAKLTEALDQLLNRYLTWRDTKVALLIFNRNRDFSNVIRTIRETVPLHSAFKKELGVLSDISSRYLLHHPNDRNREIILTALAFDLPK